MKVDLHIRKMDLEIYKRLNMYHYDLVLSDEPFETGDRGLKVLPRRNMAADSSTDKKAKPILHASLTDLNRAVEVIKMYPNRVKCVEVDLKELREWPNKVEAFKNLTSLSLWLSKRGIPLFFSSGATTAGEIVPPAVLEGFMLLISSNNRKKIYSRFLSEFFKGFLYG